jgi:PhnB protein
MKSANPYLNFKGNTEEAFNFYKAVFGGEFSAVMRFRDLHGGPGDGVPKEDLDKIAHIALPLGPNNMLMGTDTPDSFPKTFAPGNNFYVMLEPDSAAEADWIFEKLSAGGRVEMPLQQTEWAEKYGSFVDKFGVQWMLNYAGNVTFGG